MTMWCGVLCALAMVCITSTGMATELRLEPARVEPGGVVRVSVVGTAAKTATLHFDGKEVPLVAYGDVLTTVLGLDLDRAPQRYSLYVTVAGERDNLAGTIEVLPSTRPEEHLTLPRELARPSKPANLKRIERERKRLSTLFAVISPAPFWENFVLPLDGPIISVFGTRRVVNGVPGNRHPGVDFRAPAGAPIFAATAGKVVLSDALYFTGETVIVDHGEGLYSIYAHLRSRAVEVGDRVVAGGFLGEVGSTGRSTGPHLHWGVRLRGARVDPVALVELLGGKSIDSVGTSGG